jgi:GrpB-like predicted nucleotidyltransferase (UPF0157 family)
VLYNTRNPVKEHKAHRETIATMGDDRINTEFAIPRVPHHATIHLVEYNPVWPGQFAALATRIRQALKTPVAVEHVGSTAVPGLAAKPVIDILLIVHDPADESEYVPALQREGFELRLREPGWYEHRLLKSAKPDANLHVFPPDCPEARRLLLFRDRLRTRPHERQEYENRKRALADREWEYVQDYADAKSDLVEEILIRADVES